MYLILIIILYIKRNAIKEWLKRKYGADCLPKNKKVFLYSAIIGAIIGILYVGSELSADEGNSEIPIIADSIIYAVVSLYYIIRCYAQTKESVNKREIRCRYWLTAGIGFFIMVAIASALIWAAIVVFIIFILRFVNLSTGFFPGVSSSNAPSPVSAPVSDNDGSGEGSPYTPMMDPVSGDDGGILNGNTRVPLHDNGDGTMRDDSGGLYKRDGNDVRRL